MAGATGYIGSRVAAELVQHGYRLICPVRDPRSPAARQLLDLAGAAATGLSGSGHALRLVTTQLDDLQLLRDRLANIGADAVVSCIASRSGSARDSEQVDYHANHTLLSWARERNVSQFTLLSAICVQKPRLAFQHAKLRFEAELAASGISHAIVRPTAFFKSLSGQVTRVQRGKPFLCFGGGELTRCKPIAERDLAQFIRLTLEDNSLNGIQAVGGPGPAITPLDQAQLLAELTGQPLRIRSVPPKILASAAALLSAAGRVSDKAAARAEFARIGYYYATESMLVWDPVGQMYDEQATPEFGSTRLEESYRAQLAGKDMQRLGDHAVFR